MKRHDLENWLTRHPESIQGQPRTLLDQCETEVRGHAHHEAWLAARELAQARRRRFERSSSGLPASEAFVAREVCHEVARELRRHEPHLEGLSEAEWVSRSVLDALDPQARGMLRGWLLALAEREEHRAWLEIVSFTDHLSRTLIDEAQLTDDLEWDFDRSYPRLAARVTGMLVREFDAHAIQAAREDRGSASVH